MNDEDKRLIERLEGEVEFLREELGRRSGPDEDNDDQEKLMERHLDGSKHLMLASLVTLGFAVTVGSTVDAGSLFSNLVRSLLLLSLLTSFTTWFI